MPKIDELRKYLQGGNVPEVDSRTAAERAAQYAVERGEEERRRDLEAFVNAVVVEDTDGGMMPVKPAVPRRASTFPVKFRIATTGDDAVLLGGKHRQKKISDLAKTLDGASYLDWLLKKDPPPSLEEVIKKHRHFTVGQPGVQRKPPLTRSQRQKATEVKLEIDDDGFPIGASDD